MPRCFAKRAALRYNEAMSNRVFPGPGGRGNHD